MHADDTHPFKPPQTSSLPPNMVQYTKQDARSVVPQHLDLENYDAAAMLADLGPQRLKNLPLRGRVVYQTETPSMLKRPGLHNEAIAKWSQYIEKEAEELAKKGVDDVEEDGLGLGGSYRKGPNYRPMPISIGSRMGPKLPGPARFRAGARGPTSGARRRSPSPPSVRDGFLGPKPRNPTFEARHFRGQLVTRHVNTKTLTGFGEASGPVASATSHRHSIRPEPTGTAASKWNTGVLVSSSSLLNLKEVTSATATINLNSQLISGVSNTAQAASKLANITASAMPSSPQLQSSTTSPDLSRSTSRASSIFGTPASPQTKPRWFRSTAVPINTPRPRDTIRPVPEASKNHWNLAPLVLRTAEAPNEVTTHEAKSGPLTTSVTTDEAKPQLASTLLQVSSVTKQGPELEPAGRVADSATVANWAASRNPNFSTRLINIPSGQKLDTPSDTQSVTRQNATPDLSGSKDTEQNPFGLSTSKYAGPAPSGLSASKYAAPQALGLPASKSMTPEPPGLSGSKYVDTAPTGLSASKYAYPVPTGLSASKYAAPQISSLSTRKYTIPPVPELSTSRYATNSTPTSSGLSGTKYTDAVLPRIAKSGALSGLASSKYAPHQLRAAANKEMMKPQSPTTHIKTPALPAKEEKEEKEVMEIKGVIKEIVDTKEAKKDEPVIKTEDGATVLENDVAMQVPMPASQRLLDSIAARYKFASPKQVSGLARRYGTMIVAGKDSPMKSIAPQEREIDDATRAFQALFISRGRRVLRQPQLPVSHNIHNMAS